MIYRNNRRGFSLLSLSLVLLSASAAPATGRPTPPAAPDSPHPKTISIAEARHLPPGTVVTVDGSVTVPSGAFSSSTFDQGFAIQDHTGGIYVSVAGNLGFQPRRQIRVTGQLADSFGLLILVPSDTDDIKPHGRGPKVRPLPVTTGAVGESTEGKLVKVRATITQPIVNDLPRATAISAGFVHNLTLQGQSCVQVGCSPQQLLAQLIAQVQALITAGTLTQDQGDGLIDKLNQVIAKLDQDQTGAACNQLDAFIDQVNAFINNGSLTAAQGQALIDAVNAIKPNIGC